MKALKLVITAAIFMVSAFTNAVEASNADSTVVTTMSAETFDRLETGLLFGMSSDVTGVVESSLFNAVHIKIAYPEFISEAVEAELARIAIEGNSHSLRYKAYLTLNYYRTPSEFGTPEVLLSLLDNSYQNGIFFYFQERVQSEQFTSTHN
ncbi:MAG: hypothetical protein EA391_01190 [Balneolaceae bacterium]|nr:MAG: hypothetical protein EA391_01190 [Balneolaceae bacterium]